MVCSVQSSMSIKPTNQPWWHLLRFTLSQWLYCRPKWLWAINSKICLQPSISCSDRFQSTRWRWFCYYVCWGRRNMVSGFASYCLLSRLGSEKDQSLFLHLHLEATRVKPGVEGYSKDESVKEWQWAGTTSLSPTPARVSKTPMCSWQAAKVRNLLTDSVS